MTATPFTLKSPQDIAEKYGGDKQRMAKAAQMGLEDPTAVAMAGMFVDRVVKQQQAAMAPKTTVAQDALAPPAPPAPPPPPGPQAGLGALPPQGGPPPGGPAPEGMAPQGMSPPGAPAQGGPPMGMAQGGLLAAGVPDDMYDSYATGGLVSFSGGGAQHDVPFYKSRVGEAVGFPAPLTAQERTAEEAAIRKEMLKERGRSDVIQRKMGNILPDWLGIGQHTDPSAAPAAELQSAAPLGVQQDKTGLPGAKSASGVDPFTGKAYLPEAAPTGAAVDTVYTGAPGYRKGASGGGGSSISVKRRERAVVKATAAGVPKPIVDTAPSKALESVTDFYMNKAVPESISMIEKLTKENTTEEDAYADDLKQTGEKMKKRKKHDMWETLAEVGLAMMGTKRSDALGAVGEAGTAALPGARERAKDRRTEEKEARKELVGIERSKNERALARTTAALTMANGLGEMKGKDMDRAQTERLETAKLELQRQQMEQAKEIAMAQISAQLQAARIGASAAAATDFKWAVMNEAMANPNFRTDPKGATAQAQAKVYSQMHPEGENPFAKKWLEGQAAMGLTSTGLGQTGWSPQMPPSFGAVNTSGITVGAPLPSTPAR